jgi:hypothetical protein
MVRYRLLREFAGLFQGKPYRHRSSQLGDWVAMQLYEDLCELGKSHKLCQRIQQQQRVLNVENRRRGISARRGDGTFGEIVPGATAIVDEGFIVARATIATVEIGTEVKILGKAMIKQIGRVIHDLTGQVDHFKRGAGNPICVGVVGVNWARVYTSYEAERVWRTDGKKYAHPLQEASAVEDRLRADAQSTFDEFLILRFRATNESPFPFAWVDLPETELDYGAILTRISREYDRRF